jgi:hypothetical protein
MQFAREPDKIFKEYFNCASEQPRFVEKAGN